METCPVATNAETIPILCVDDADADTSGLVSDAGAGAFVRDSRFYPGIRRPAPGDYVEWLVRRLSPAVRDLMGWRGTDPLAALASHFSLVTDPPASLSPLQRIPHVDSSDPNVVAVLHYLCGPEHGGTSFYRHRSTGFARITDDRRAIYDAALDRDVARHGPPPPGYMEQAGGAFASVFERIRTIDCHAGRIVAYPANALHCGRIPANAWLSAVPGEGRLTVNTFLRRARGPAARLKACGALGGQAASLPQ